MDTNIQKYMAFITTVEQESFTKAAEKLSYSQSGVSRMIGDLEKEWHVKLLERSRTKVRLTSEGLCLLPYVKSICEDHKRLQAQINELNGLRSGLIRIGTFSSVATHWIPNIIKEFQKDFPNIEYELLLGDYAEIENWVADGRVDCGFVRLPAADGLDTVFLDQDKLLAIIPENHRFARCEYFPIEELEKEPFMLLEKSGNTEMSEMFKHYGIKPNVRFTTWDDYAIMSMVESGLGISVLPQLILKRVPYNIITKELSVPAHRDIGLALRDKNAVTPAVRRFMDYLKYR